MNEPYRSPAPCEECRDRQQAFAEVGVEFRPRDGAGKTLGPFLCADDHGRPVLHLGAPDPKLHPGTEHWIVQLRTWHANGTFLRLRAAMEARQPVQVRRSDGTTSVGVITSTAGFGGRSIEVEVETPEGKRYKNSGTEEFLELNPGFGPHLRELVPEGER